MRNLFFSVLVLCFWLPVQGFSSGSEGLVPVPALDLAQYSGNWHEVASIPAPFERDCTGFARAEYEMLANGVVKVLNSCAQANGSRASTEGRLRMNPSFSEPGKLQATFSQGADWNWDRAGDYWVIDLGANYEYAVVGNPNYEYGWILARTETLDSDTLVGIADRLDAQGYDSCEFLLTNNSEQRFPPNARPALCDQFRK